MAQVKAYKPLSYVEALALLTRLGIDVESANWDDGQVLIYAETLRIHQRMDEIENQANEMMSPDKMMELAQGFLGGGLH